MRVNTTGESKNEWGRITTYIPSEILRNKTALLGLLVLMVLLILQRSPPVPTDDPSRLHHHKTNLLQDVMTANVTTMLPRGFVHNDKIFGHIHMAKTAGTELNGILAARYERVCGHKGYSYDAFQFNKRVAEGKTRNSEFAGAPDVISAFQPRYNRGRVPMGVMREIGFEDCDYVSIEQNWYNYKDVAAVGPLELHVPCREPLDLFMSQCNYRLVRFNCNAENLEQEVEKCMLRKFLGRFSYQFLEMPNVTAMKCFNPIPLDGYLNYMDGLLQRKRHVTEHIHRDTNRRRVKSRECIWNNKVVADRVMEIILKEDYYKYCSECLGSKDDLLAHLPSAGQTSGPSS